MKEILLKNGWINYRTGCSCIGLPRYWKNDDRPGWIVITKGSGYFSIMEKDVVLFRGTDRNFEQNMKKYELIN